MQYFTTNICVGKSSRCRLRVHCKLDLPRFFFIVTLPDPCKRGDRIFFLYLLTQTTRVKRNGISKRDVALFLELIYKFLCINLNMYAENNLQESNKLRLEDTRE